jgi:cyclic beta-1,2-glucan synthetase
MEPDSESESESMDFATLEPSYETDRMQFIGRDRTLVSPQALE